MPDELSGYWYSRFVFERGLAFIYLIAFVCAANQFVPLLGERGLLPVSTFTRTVPFRASPSLFYLGSQDSVLRLTAWIGVALSLLALSGMPQRLGTIWAAATWAMLWILYLSFVNVGQIFYAFGWETLLLEVGFVAIFAGGSATAPNRLVIWIWRWTLFRVMFGAGLIKLRGDSCWRDLTCLDYYFETQPIPNAFSWYFHHFPPLVHRIGVAINHIVELGVPFLYFLPQPVAAVGGLVTIAFQGTLILSGNLSWLNWITIVLCIPTLDDRWWAWLPIAPPAALDEPRAHRIAVGALAAVVALLSIRPIRNMASPAQVMNSSFEPLHLVNTYGAFGSITRVRYEIVIEGTREIEPTERTEWRAYEFKGKPGDPMRRPPQIAPYHLRLDWLMWFAAMSAQPEYRWFDRLIEKLLEGDPATLGLLRENPFPDHPPRWIRALYYEYRFTSKEEQQRTGEWWHRELRGFYMFPVRLRQ